MKVYSYTIIKIVIVMVLLFGAAPGEKAFAEPFLLDGVPAYYWYHGCAPTGLAMIIGYYDLHGYSNMFPGISGWEDTKVTDKVKQFISRDAHNNYYDAITPDNPFGCQSPDCNNDQTGPAPEPDCIAGFWGISRDPLLSDGWGSLISATAAAINYAAHRGYEFRALNRTFGQISFSYIKYLIDSGYPVMAFVNSGVSNNHFVAIIGYDENYAGSGQTYYAFYDGYLENEGGDAVKWKLYQNSDNAWGIEMFTLIVPVTAPESALSTAIKLMRITCGFQADYTSVEDIGNDGKIGLVEAIHALQKAGGIR